MKCPKCGLDISSSSNFCSHCGNSLKKQNEEIPGAQNSSASVQSNESHVDRTATEKYILGSRPDTYNETIVFECYPSLRITNFQTAVLSAILGITIIIIIIYKLTSAVPLFSGIFALEFLLLLIGVIGLSGYYAYKTYFSYSNHFKITTQRIFVTRGLINKEIDEIELEKYKDIIVRQNFLEKICGCGNIEVISGDSSCPVLLIPDVDNPIDKKEMIRSAARERKSLLGITRREEI